MRFDFDIELGAADVALQPGDRRRKIAIAKARRDSGPIADMTEIDLQTKVAPAERRTPLSGLGQQRIKIPERLLCLRGDVADVNGFMADDARRTGDEQHARRHCRPREERGSHPILLGIVKGADLPRILDVMPRLGGSKEEQVEGISPAA